MLCYLCIAYVRYIFLYVGLARPETSRVRSGNRLPKSFQPVRGLYAF